MDNKKIIFILIATALLSWSWFIFSDEHQIISDFWCFFGLDITEKFDIFPLSDNSQRLKWYAHDTGYFLSLCFLSYIIKNLSKARNRALFHVTNVFFYFSVFRLFEYWIFRFHIGLTAIILGFIIFSLSSINFHKWHK